MNYARTYKNRDTGEILNEIEAKKQWREEYDGDDPTNPARFEEQYALERFWYGMTERGFSIGCQPTQGFVERIDDETGEYYDIIIYDHWLPAEEAARYELLPIKVDFC